MIKVYMYLCCVYIYCTCECTFCISCYFPVLKICIHEKCLTKDKQTAMQETSVTTGYLKLTITKEAFGHHISSYFYNTNLWLSTCTVCVGNGDGSDSFAAFSQPSGACSY